MPKLTLRDLFAVVTIVALALGWWLDRSRLAGENESLRDMIVIEILKQQRDQTFRKTPIESAKFYWSNPLDQTSHSK
ncbi:MAG: hypothetical protein KY475_17815 [Planctomycetes bacterium]|nr:hypothetical protein [Planctomycetota bacterium]